MSSARPLPQPEDQPPALHARAMDNLAFIRETMERAGTFTAVSGWGMVAVGALAAVSSIALPWRPLTMSWTLGWIVTAALAVLISVAATMHKARRAGIPVLSGPGRKLLLAFAPAMAVGALLTVVLYRANVPALLPGVWLLLYGAAVIGGGVFSVRIVPVMGVCFMALGAAALFLPSDVAVRVMQGAFVVLHLAFGGVIVRGHGG